MSIAIVTLIGLDVPRWSDEPRRCWSLPRGVGWFTLPITNVTPFGLDISQWVGEPRRCWEHMRDRGVRAVVDVPWRVARVFTGIVHYVFFPEWGSWFLLSTRQVLSLVGCRSIAARIPFLRPHSSYVADREASSNIQHLLAALLHSDSLSSGCCMPGLVVCQKSKPKELSGRGTVTFSSFRAALISLRL